MKAFQRMATSGILVAVFMCMVLIGAFVTPITVFATGNLGDDLTPGQGVVPPAAEQSVAPPAQGSQGGNQGVTDWIKGYNPVTSDQMGVAGKFLAPIINVVGYIIGGILVVTTACIFLFSAIDLFYIAVPPVRRFLFSPNTDGTGAATAGRFGMGMRGGMMGGMGGYGGMMGGAQPAVGGSGAGILGGGSILGLQWVSDEAVACSAMFGGSATTAGIDMNGGQQPQQQRGSVLWMYLRKRLFFLILFGVCSVVLTSSILVGSGINIAQWIMNLVVSLSGKIPT